MHKLDNMRCSGAAIVWKLVLVHKVWTDGARRVRERVKKKKRTTWLGSSSYGESFSWWLVVLNWMSHGPWRGSFCFYQLLQHCVLRYQGPFDGKIVKTWKVTFCHLLRSTGLCFCLFPCFLFQYFCTYSNKKECSFLQSLGSASFPQDIEENSEARVWIDTIEG